MSTPTSIAIIGAGLSGMTCAHVLQKEGHAVTLFEKSRGPGGRLTTRRRDTATYDHGAQYFTAHSEAFAAEVARWDDAGVVARWDGRFAAIVDGELRPDLSTRTRWVGTPKMSSLGRHLATGLSIRLQTRVTSLQGGRGAWTLHDESGDAHGPFDLVLVSAPGPQAKALLPERSSLQGAARALLYAPCWAVMADYAEPALSAWDGLKVDAEPLSWIARDSSKPGRPEGERWVLHASAAWSHRYLEEPPEFVIAALTDALRTLGAPAPTQAQAHRWRYALSVPATGEPAMFAAEEGLGLMGDGLIHPRVESAWASGIACADRVLAAL